MGPFSEGFRAARICKDDNKTNIPCPYKSGSKAAGDWEHGWDFQMEKPDVR